MQSKYNKTIVLVGLFLIVLAVGIFIKTDTGRGYISWLRATASNMIGTDAEAPSYSELADNIDLSNISINAPKQENTASKPAEEPEQAAVAAVSAKPADNDIEAVVNDISQQIAKINSEIEQMAAYSNIQMQIDQIAIQADQIGQAVNTIRTSSQMTEIQQRVNVLSQEISALSHQTSFSS